MCLLIATKEVFISLSRIFARSSQICSGGREKHSTFLSQLTLRVVVYCIIKVGRHENQGDFHRDELISREIWTGVLRLFSPLADLRGGVFGIPISSGIRIPSFKRRGKEREREDQRQRRERISARGRIANEEKNHSSS